MSGAGPFDRSLGGGFQRAHQFQAAVITDPT